MNSMSEPDDFDELVAGLEEELNARVVEKRGARAVAATRVTGLVYQVAVTAGVPHDLALVMAEDYWASEMRPSEVVMVEDE
ncbi:hypothetical protein AB0G83_07690 [Streptomyces klenkii]|uniref:hypothetical protein n=1 Tax=Streptomyces klenkii TaxID=1420899 RepID=UPI0033EC7A14